MGFKHYSPSPMAAMADPWENVVERDIIHLDANHFIIDVSNSVLFLEHDRVYASLLYYLSLIIVPLYRES